MNRRVSGHYAGVLADIIRENQAQAKAEDEFADLIEGAFLAGMITRETQELVYLWLANIY